MIRRNEVTKTDFILLFSDGKGLFCTALLNTIKSMTKFEAYFDSYRKEIVGIDQQFNSPFGEKKIIYADWIASGRLYHPIERQITDVFGPLVGNTHSETSETGALMTHAYHQAQQIHQSSCECRTKRHHHYSGFRNDSCNQ